MVSPVGNDWALPRDHAAVVEPWFFLVMNCRRNDGWDPWVWSGYRTIWAIESSRSRGMLQFSATAHVLSATSDKREHGEHPMGSGLCGFRSHGPPCRYLNIDARRPIGVAEPPNSRARYTHKFSRDCQLYPALSVHEHPLFRGDFFCPAF